MPTNVKITPMQNLLLTLRKGEKKGIFTFLRLLNVVQKFIIVFKLIVYLKIKIQKNLMFKKKTYKKIKATFVTSL